MCIEPILAEHLGWNGRVWMWVCLVCGASEFLNSLPTLLTIKWQMLFELNDNLAIMFDLKLETKNRFQCESALLSGNVDWSWPNFKWLLLATAENTRIPWARLGLGSVSIAKLGNQLLGAVSKRERRRKCGQRLRRIKYDKHLGENQRKHTAKCKHNVDKMYRITAQRKGGNKKQANASCNKTGKQSNSQSKNVR